MLITEITHLKTLNCIKNNKINVENFKDINELRKYIRSKYQKNYTVNHKEKSKEYMKTYYEENKEKMKSKRKSTEYFKEYYQKNKDKFLQKSMLKKQEKMEKLQEEIKVLL